MRQLVTLFFVLGVIACAGSRPATVSSGATESAATTADITPADLRKRLFIIAHDSMLGRETGSEGNYKTQAYIAAEFQRLGLEPAGENGTYFQAVPFWRVAIDPASRLSVDGRALRLYTDFIPTSSAPPALDLPAESAIYAGSLADTTKMLAGGPSLTQVVVVDVPPGTPNRLLTIINTRYAASVLRVRVQLDDVAPEQMARLRDGRPVPDTTRNPRAAQGMMITRAAAARIFGAELSTLTPGAKSRPLTARLDFSRTATPRPARNVVAIFRGSDPALRGQYLSLTAHNDHVGFDRSPVDHDSLRAFNRVVRPMGADSPQRDATDEARRIRAILDSFRRANQPRKDSIRNGADDDGSGTVAILEVAEKLVRGPRPKRSVLFVSHTGEEDGLVGSRWFTDHSTVPIDSIVAEIDQDMIGRGLPSDLPGGFDKPAGTPTYLEVIGSRRLSREFGDSLEAANARQQLPFNFDYTYDAPGHPLQYYCRADHYSYARYGIPAVAFSRGGHLDYHQITDEPQYIDYPDLARVANMVYTAALSIANMTHRPKLDAPKPPLNQPCRQ